MVLTKEQNITLVGDVGCGKTSLVSALKRFKFPDKEISADPFIVVTHTVEDKHIVKILSYIWDIPSFENWSTFHPFYYGHTDVVILCFSVDSRESLKNATRKWMLEIETYCKPNVPVILVGNKSDMRQEESKSVFSSMRRKYVTAEEGRETGEKIGAFAYIECSAKNSKNIKEMFLTATKATQESKKDSGVNKPEKHSSQCCILS